MKINAFQYLEKMAEKTAKKKSHDHERIIVEWTAKGALLIHLDVSSQPKIKSFVHLNLDSSFTESDKKNAFDQFLKTAGSKEYPKAVLLWSEGMTFRQLSMADMPTEDLVKALVWDLKKKYYFNQEESLFSYKPVMEIEGAEGPEKLYSIFYCENKIAFPRLNFILGLGLEILSLTPSSVAMMHFVSSLEPIPQKDTLICELTEMAVRIVICRENNVLLARNVSITSASESLTDDFLNRVLEEIRKTADYYEGQKYSHAVGRVVFAGEKCEAGKILDFMTSKLEMSVVIPDLEKYLLASTHEDDKNFIRSNPGLFMASLGAVMMPDDLNMAPEDIKTKNRTDNLKHLLDLGLVVFGIVLAAIAGIGALNINLMKSRLAILESQYKGINERKKVFEQTLSNSRIRRAARRGDIPIASFLKELGLRTPAVIALREVQYNRLEGTVIISGDVTDVKREPAKVVTQFLNSLTESVFIQTAKIASTNQTDGSDIFQFQIACTVRGFS